MDATLSAQEVLENLKDRWYQADNPPADLLLTEEEFLSFLHPEHSRGMLKFMVKEIIRDLDQDGDKQLSLPEFISLPVGTVENQQGQDIDDNWVKDRKKEFEELIDSNHDSIVTMEELEVSVPCGWPGEAGRALWTALRFCTEPAAVVPRERGLSARRPDPEVPSLLRSGRSDHCVSVAQATVGSPALTSESGRLYPASADWL
ncbi:PREDICTED: 45 kDa calcium-binding protein-like [Dipodomys ordii]|uniref:45 kDa calcium-binding protein-like n=1 Tax=Dipodomys ordii TaxID=10020 RepID=A0A1S3GU07_DIPOR|nr:PREDICTED: 45 kDa calcium-binding protein-like [Dipodomys ordii]